MMNTGDKRMIFGFLIEEPREGERLHLLREDKLAIRSSPVKNFVSLCSDRLWVIETRKSIYVLKKE